MKRGKARAIKATEITAALVRARPLPVPGDGGKEERGRLLVMAGSAELPGAALLVADSGLRAGAGKVTLATSAGSVTALGVALPEARVMALPSKLSGRLFEERDAIVIGPGMESRAATRWADDALAEAGDAPLLLDAAAMEKLWSNAQLRRRHRDGSSGRCIVTPHAGELAGMADLDQAAIVRAPEPAAAQAAEHLGVLVVLKAGATTAIATPDGKLFRYYGRIPGLAMSGSGDVLAGLIGGLLARGAKPVDACLWGVFLHAQAGRRLAARLGSIGYRASELARELPALMDGAR
jgi:ADP-dependent NAD(P)H-hydrate dehydratase